MKRYKDYQSFSEEKFRSPDTINAPIYTWVWNSPVSRALIDRQLQEMREAGIEATYILPQPYEFRPVNMATKLEPEYLSEEFFDLVRYAAERAESLGMVAWLYDEGGWPSGSACGKVIKNLPESRAKQIEKISVLLSAGDGLPAMSELGVANPVLIISAFVDGKRTGFDFVAEADCTADVYVVTERSGDLPQLTDKRAVDEFIRVTHEGYKCRMGDLFGKAIFAVFTDEPKVVYPYYLSDVEEFERESGFDFAACVPALFEARTDEEKRFKAAYIDYVSRKFADVYFSALADWCHKNSLLFCGHVDKDDEIRRFEPCGGNLLRVLRKFDIPGVDSIWRQVFLGKRVGYFPRFASSAAAQSGNRYALTESFAAYGDGLTGAQKRFICGSQLVRGINILNFMSVTSDRESIRSLQLRPVFNPEIPDYIGLVPFNAWAKRMSHICSVGTPVRDAAVFVPCTDILLENEDVIGRFEKIAERLEDSAVDFDFVDGDFLCDSELIGGKLCMGLAAYNCLFIPLGVALSQKQTAKLCDFEAAGGKVIFADENTEIPGELSLAFGTPFIRGTHRRDGETDIYVFFSECNHVTEFCPNIDPRGRDVYILDPVDGRIFKHALSERLEILPGAELVVLVTADELSCDEKPARPSKIKEINDFEITIESETVFSEDHLERREGHRTVESLPDHFSGTVRFDGSFSAVKEQGAVIEIVGTDFCVSVSVNGENLGTRVMPPYRFDAPCELVKNENRLAIAVSTTAAGALCQGLSGKNLPFSGPYNERCLDFESDSDRPIKFTCRVGQ